MNSVLKGSKIPFMAQAVLKVNMQIPENPTVTSEN